MSRRTGPNSGPHCQGSWQQTPIVGQGKEFGYIFQRGPQLQTNPSNRLLSKPFCPHSSPLSLLLLLLLLLSGVRDSHSHLTEPQRGGWTWRTGMQEVRRRVELVALLPCRDPVPCRAQDAGSTLPYLDGVFGKQSGLCVVLLQPIKPLNSISIFEEDAQRSTWDVQGERRWVGGRGGQLTGLNNPQTAELNKACLRCNPINLANWIKLFRFYLCTAVAMYTHRASPQWSLSSSFSAGIRLIMSPFRLHMIMVDCLQVFSDVLAVPGHGGIELRAWKVTHACGGLVLERAAVKKSFTFLTVENTDVRQHWICTSLLAFI